MHKSEVSESHSEPAATARISRRDLLARGAAAATTVAAGGSLLSACGSGGSAGGGRKDAVNLLSPIDPGLTEMNKYLLPQFTKETGIKVNLLLTEWGTLLQKVVRDAQNNTGAYDLEIINDSWIAVLAGAGLSHDLAELGVKPDADQFEAIVAESYFPRTELPLPPSAKGKKRIYASQCIIADATALVYRKDLVETPPTTWNAVLTAARTKSQPAKNLYGYCFPGSQANGDPTWWLAQFFSYGGRIFDDHWNPLVNSPAGVQSLEMVLALEKTASPGVAQFGFDQLSQALNNGQTVSALGFSGWIKDVFNPAKSKVADKMACIANPSGTIPASALATFSTAIPRSARNPEGAAKLLSWLVSPRIQRKYADQFGGVSMRPSILGDPKLVAKHPYFTGMHDTLAIGKTYPSTELASGVYNVMIQQLGRAYSEQGRQGAKTYLDAMATQLRQVLKQGGYYS